MIEFQSVTKRYDDGATAVDDLDLRVETGSITVFVGPSGCGKTTSLRMVNRMLDPTSGRILVDGKDVMESDPALLRRGIGYVIQHSGLFPHRNVLDNIATVPMLSGEKKPRARARARELLDVVGLSEELAERYPAQLSGGQQQRVGVARALAADPPILLMDEPFSAVDPVVRDELQDELLRLQAELDKTIVFVTHDIDEAVKLGEKVAVFREGGKLAQYDEPSKVLRQPADEFVAGFVGRDRGYRGLSFVEPGAFTLQTVPTTRFGEPLDGPTRDWTLALDEQDRPRGWLAPGTVPDGVVTQSALSPNGSLYLEGSPLRGALDSALSSPANFAVVVDGEGTFRGVVPSQTVLETIEGSKPERAADV
ncbi:ABC transporter ATP-binding protein [Sciscionella marina]|uniref:ABC transporter ATP-binding protein n=1 Tax=Sciscionella marina TaxID=508770 RepID=UPI00036454F5|nr:ATP-binding cassette domain-containing protein [Sciscionella marina]